MPNTYRTTDEITAQRLDDGSNTRLSLHKMGLFASGAFSNVYRGFAVTPSNHQMEIVIKKTWPRNSSAPMEVKILAILGKLKHKNIVRLLYSYQKQIEGRNLLGLIFECVPSNLHQFLKDNNRRIDIVEVKLITWQLFRGQAHLQKNDVCHRDIKPQNLLYDSATGLLKISDYGSSAIQASRSTQQSYHVTRYYRPPELLLGSRNYGCEIDIWSCGCVFGELLKGGIFLAGKSAINQAEVIFDALGIPTKDELSMMRVSSTKYREIVQMYEPDPLRKTTDFNWLYEQNSSNQRERRTTVFNDKIDSSDMKQATELLRLILVYNPKQRLAGLDLLTNPYFSDLFKSSTLRNNRQVIGCLTKNDLREVEKGDTSQTHETTE
ncbi:hypothetical protein L3Y34_014517 [Caenorhabditis briggsae]|uniref:Protein kinase domain-containing protein n=1 Tax=Caenorhabditis briggsae TaxID=6238 RepID=A0AAE9DTB1_CAEBR|nr:hypothetical protein L3Y34_014517 [Caenorhabditis briggsae]